MSEYQKLRKYLTEDDIIVWNLFSLATEIWETKRLFYDKI